MESCSGEAHAVKLMQRPWDIVHDMLSNVRRPAPEFTKHEECLTMVFLLVLKESLLNH